MSLKDALIARLTDFREQGKIIADINPISALADELSERLYKGQITQSELETLMEDISGDLWQAQTAYLRVKSGLEADPNDAARDGFDVTQLDFTRPVYGAVFTAHPVFAMQRDNAHKIAQDAVANQPACPANAYAPRNGITLADEHEEAMQAVEHARAAMRQVTRALLAQQPRRDIVPRLLSASSWVGYDLDGRDDISWIDSFRLRLEEKRRALELYLAQCADQPLLDEIAARLTLERDATAADIANFAKIDSAKSGFVEAANQLTGRADKLTGSAALAEEIAALAAKADTDDAALDILTLAGDMACHGFGMGEIHLRINAVQLRNAMRSVDGRAVLTSGEHVPSRLLIDRLGRRIENEESWQINFVNLDEEMATARRQFMLATQILKHVDSDIPIRFLIAECEQPITLMSALYLAHKFGIADQLDISPLLETTFGLEHGAKMMEQLCETPAYRHYLEKRGRLSIQTGFSDAGRFMGQIAANLAIERMQLKIAELVKTHFDGTIDLLMFNTHGESMGRGCARGAIDNRQQFIFSAYAREKCRQMGVHVQHQSSFQGGDGYRLFANPEIALSVIDHLLRAELRPASPAEIDDPFYAESSFALDMFLALKAWHEKLFFDPHYIELLDMFGTNLLPVSGSRPSKRVVQAGMGRRDPSKIRAIPHNAILQQTGFLANVISGFGTAANVDSEGFMDIYARSPRLQILMRHVLDGKARGSLNTLSAYGRLLDKNFWIDRAYHDFQPDNLRPYRRLADSLGESRRAIGVRNILAKLRDDLIDLYRLTGRIGESGVRVEGQDRLLPDVLHALRIALISEALVLLARVPRFAESSRNRNEDVLRHALRLDFKAAIDIIVEEFSLGEAGEPLAHVAEPESYSANHGTDYREMEHQIIEPLKARMAMLDRLTQMVSAVYDAHG